MFGSISVAEAAGGGIGIYSAGMLFEQTGDYTVALNVMLAVMGFATLLALALRAPTVTQSATA